LSYWPNPATLPLPGEQRQNSAVASGTGTERNLALRARTRSIPTHRGGLASKRGLAMRSDHSMILATTPAPTVRPPSRMAKRRPSSIAIGAISSTVIWTLSPGITISTPSGSSQVPVTSVVRK